MESTTTVNSITLNPPLDEAGQKFWPASRWILPTVLLGLGVACLFTTDTVIASYFAGHPAHGEFHDFLDACEHFGTPYGQVLVLMTLLTVGCLRFPRAVFIFAGTTAAGLSANVVKLIVARSRPRTLDFADFTVWDGFTGMFPFGAGGSAVQSFPSAHTASAFGFAAMMIWAFPKGRPAFLVLATLTGLQRVTANAHFASDVCLGAALGFSVASLFVYSTPISRIFNRWDASISPKV